MHYTFTLEQLSFLPQVFFTLLRVSQFASDGNHSFEADGEFGAALQWAVDMMAGYEEDLVLRSLVVAHLYGPALPLWPR